MECFIILTMVFFSAIFAYKRHIAPNLIFINIHNLNKMLRSEVFMSEDRQLKAVHLILGFQPLSDKFLGCGPRNQSR